MSPRCERLANGLRVVLVPCEAESVAVGVFVASGSRHEQRRVAGISHLLEHMLFKGTPTRRSLDITRAIEGRGGNFNACTSEEATIYYAHLPSDYLEEAVDILADMYLHASIPAEEFVREKAVVLEEIKMYADEPDAVALEKLQRNLFPGSPLGSPIAGSAQSLKPLKPGDLKRYLRAHYRPDNTVIVIAGSFDEATALAAVSRTWGRCPAARRRKPWGDAPLSAPVRAAETVTKDIQQAQLALGYRTFGIADPRKYAATVLDAVLGRGMSSRLFQEVREQRGLSYDIASRWQFFADAGMFVISAGLDSSKESKALTTIDRELKRVREKRVSAAELRRTKEFLLGNFRLAHEKVVSKMFYYGSTLLSFGRLVLPEEQIAGINAVTPAEVQAVARSVFRPANRSVSWVVPKV